MQEFDCDNFKSTILYYINIKSCHILDMSDTLCNEHIDGLIQEKK